MKVISLVGQKFGLLEVVALVRTTDKGAVWFCKCECGGTCESRADSLKNVKGSRNKNCGCLTKESAWNRTHGMTNTPEYQAYCQAKIRCTNPKYKKWKDYGGRGIKFLFTSFEQFFAELGPRPAGMSLDRINNDGNYEPGNVRWATDAEQNTNRRGFKINRRKK